MRLQELLNKISNVGFLLTVVDYCDELSFREYEQIKKEKWFAECKNKKIEDICILLTNEMPELNITLKKERN